MTKRKRLRRTQRELKRIKTIEARYGKDAHKQWGKLGGDTRWKGTEDARLAKKKEREELAKRPIRPDGSGQGAYSHIQIEFGD